MYACPPCVEAVSHLSTCGSEGGKLACPVRVLSFSGAVPVLTVFVKLLVVKEIEITAVLAGSNFSYL